MCGRYVSAAPPDELAAYFGASQPTVTLEANYNVAPTNEVYVVRADDGQRAMATLAWGLVPFWAKEPKVGSRMINARSETAPDKPAFRRAYQKRRCLIPADGFYEWAKVEGHKAKQPYFIHRPDEEPLAFAGLWEHWTEKQPDGDIGSGPAKVATGSSAPGRTGPRSLTTCAILTTSANLTMQPVHDRMPVFVPPNRWDDWLDPTSDADELRSLLVPAPEGLLILRPVTTLVNNVRNKGAELVAEASADELIGAP